MQEELSRQLDRAAREAESARSAEASLKIQYDSLWTDYEAQLAEARAAREQADVAIQAARNEGRLDAQNGIGLFNLEYQFRITHYRDNVQSNLLNYNHGTLYSDHRS